MGVTCEVQARHRDFALLTVDNHRWRFAGQLGCSLSLLSCHEWPNAGEKEWTHSSPRMCPRKPASPVGLIRPRVTVDGTRGLPLEGDWGVLGISCVPDVHPQISHGLIFYLLAILSSHAPTPRCCC